MANPDLELRKVGGGGVVVLALPAFLLSVTSSSCNQNKGGGRAPQASPQDPPLQLGGKMLLISKSTPPVPRDI